MFSKQTTIKIEISPKTIIFAVFFLLGLKFLWMVKDLIFSLFIALILVSALKPPVDLLEKKRLPRGLAVVIVYFTFLFVVGNLIGLIIPPLINEISHLLRNFPLIIQNSAPYLSSFVNPEALIQYVPDITQKTIGIIKEIFSNTFFIITTLFFGFYLLLEENFLKKILANFYEEKSVQQILSISEKVETALNRWFWGEIVLMTVVGVMTFIGLNLIGIKYALALSVFAGFLEVVPNIGPIVSMFPAVLIGFSQSYFLGFAALALYFLVQQLENNMIVPLVMKKAVGLSPLVTLAVLIIGGKLAGVLGMLLAIPTTLFLQTVLIEMVKTKKQTGKKSISFSAPS